MDITKHLKELLSNSYQLESEFIDIIEDCFCEIFKEHKAYILSEFEEDLSLGLKYNGCLQGLEYYKQRVADNIKLQKIKENKEKENE